MSIFDYDSMNHFIMLLLKIVMFGDIERQICKTLCQIYQPEIHTTAILVTHLKFWLPVLHIKTFSESCLSEKSLRNFKTEDANKT